MHPKLHRRWRWWWAFGLIVGLLSSTPRASQTTSAAPPPPNSVGLLSIYVLAYDNRPGSSLDLTPHYSTTLSSLVSASSGHPEKLAVVLADLHGQGDTHIRLIYDGSITTVFGLPDASGVLSPTLNEYDVTDAATLGGFLRWVRARFQSERTTLSYIGHGTPLVPETDLSLIFGPNPLRPAAALPPLPTNIGANPDLTDNHTPPGSPLSYGALTPYALAQALALASALNQPLDVIDVVMCFGASAEEFTELAPYTRMLVGSPNYEFFDPTSPGAVLASWNPAMTPDAMAISAVDTYHAMLPSSQHPRILIAVDAQQMQSVKDVWDATAQALYQLLQDPGQRAPTRQKLIQAYQASYKYDLAQCPPHDWELAAPDGLVDLRHFADNLRQQFQGTAVATWAEQTELRISDPLSSTGAIIHRRSLSDVPWFAPSVSPWTFDGSDPTSIDDDAAGLSLYADLVGRPVSASTVELSWHAHWYHDDDTVADNQHPYQFVRDMSTAVGWDEVFQDFWSGFSLTTAACLPEYPVARNPEPATDLVLRRIVQPAVRFVPLNQPMVIGAEVVSRGRSPGSLLHVQVQQNSGIVFDQRINVGPLLPGNYQLNAPLPWRPTSLEPFSITITIDSDDRVAETNEQNNLLVFKGEVVNRPPLPLIQASTAQRLLSTRTLVLQITQNQATLPAINRIIVQVYQYAQATPGEPLRPVLRGRLFIPVSSLPDVALTLPPSVEPGALMLHIWGVSPAGRSTEPALLRLNYAPPNVALAPGAQDVYQFFLQRGDSASFSLAVQQGNADLALWEPFVDEPPTQQSAQAGGDSVIIDQVPLSGPFTLVVQGDVNSSSSYTLSVLRNGQPARQPASVGSGLAGIVRPQIIEPVVENPWRAFLPFILSP